MNQKHKFAAVFFSLAMVSSLVGVNPVGAKDAPTSVILLEEAKAKNTGGTAVKEAGDSIIIEFSETTNKFTINAVNINIELKLSNAHSFLDGAGTLGAANWSDDGEKLKIVLSANTSLPTVAPGDTVTVTGTGIKDLDNNAVTGNVVITGGFSAVTDDDDDKNCADSISTNTLRDDDDDERCDNDDRDSGKYRCGNGLDNGRLFKLANSQTVYLLTDCRLKPFRGNAAFRSRGHKFEDIQVLNALPANISVSEKPVLPAEGTLIKGSDKTVWFVEKSGKRRGFVSAEVFTRLGFKFEQVDEISNSDLTEVGIDTAIGDSTVHPDGSLIKCGNSTAVFTVIDKLRFPFVSAKAFQNRGHRFDHILVVDCGRFAYKEAAAITE